jgi:hypothetical protein
MPLTDVSRPDVSTPPPAPAPIRAFRILPEFLDALWSQAEPLLKRGVQTERGRYSTRDIYHWIKTNEQQLWVVMRGREMIAAGLMRCYIHPSGKHGAAWHLLGAKPGARVWEWIDSLIEAGMAEARARGSSEMVIVGRHGWLRFAKRYGFKPEATVLLREETEL